MADESIERARDALGMTVPPTWLARAGTWLRNVIGRVHALMAPGVFLIYERSLGIVDNKALYCAVELEIPDVLADGPCSADGIAAAIDADPDAVERLLRYLVSRDLFVRKRDGRFANNGATRMLQKNHPYSWRDWVLFLGSDWNSRIFHQLPARVREGKPAAESAFGMSFFDYVHKENPKARDAFHGAMAAGSRIQSLLFAETIDLSPYKHVCDVGGGTGSTLAHLLRTRADMRGTLFDVPEIEKEAQEFLESAGVSDRATFVGGDFFESVPPGCDLYTLFAVVHDWDNESCVQILSNIRDVMAAGGRTMIVEKPILAGAGYDFAKSADMIMLALGDGGRERMESDYEALFTKAGLRLRRRTTLPSLFRVFELSAR